MTDDTLYVEDQPQREDVAVLDDRLYEYHAALTWYHDGRWLAIFVRDGAGSIVAGMDVGGTGFVRSLWVREDLRGQGLGRQILAAAEEEAVRRGCRVMRLETHSYQAPGFYGPSATSRSVSFQAGPATAPWSSFGRR